MEGNRDDVSLPVQYGAMAQKKGRGKVPGLSGYYAVVFISSAGKGTGHDRHRVDPKEPGLPRIIRLHHRVMDLGT